MLKKLMGRGPVVVVVCVGVVLAAAGGFATAAVSDAHGAVHACYHVDGQGNVGADSTLRVIDPTSTKNGGGACKKDERPITLTGPELPQGCLAGQTLKFSLPAGSWGCGDDLNTTYSAGSGLALNGTTFSTDPAAVQSRVVGSCGGSQAIQSIGEDGTVSCGEFSGSQHVFTPKAVQINSTTGSVVLIDRGVYSLVGLCTPVAAQIVVRDASGHGLNVVSDSRSVHRGQTMTSGDLAVASASVTTPMDRGELNMVDTADASTLNASFYAVFTQGPPATCQYNISALGA